MYLHTCGHVHIQTHRSMCKQICILAEWVTSNAITDAVDAILCSAFPKQGVWWTEYLVGGISNQTGNFSRHRPSERRRRSRSESWSQVLWTLAISRLSTLQPKLLSEVWVVLRKQFCGRSLRGRSRDVYAHLGPVRHDRQLTCWQLVIYKPPLLKIANGQKGRKGNS